MTWRVARAILALPFVATVVVPAIILAAGGGWSWDLDGGARAATIGLGAVLIVAGLGLFVSTVRLFATEGGERWRRGIRLRSWSSAGPTAICATR